MNVDTIISAIEPYLSIIIGIVVGYIGSILAHASIWKAYSHFSKNGDTQFLRLVNQKLYRPTRYLFLTIVTYLIVNQIDIDLSETIQTISMHVVSFLLLVSAVYCCIRLITVIEEAILHHYKVNVKDNLRARQVHTQVKILKRITIVILIVLSIGSYAMSFELFKALGAGILASAGIFGIVIGFAAQKILGNLLAGIQIAITQPIRLDDVVIVENEWGRIEEITLTYVVVRIWDLRRLVLPISYFIEKPFQNWTRVSADILGTVYLYLDYSIPVEKVREKLTEILAQSDKWNKKANSLQITNTTEKAIEVRALMSADDASLTWDLRCEVREKLIVFLQEEFPESLPKNRVQLERDK